MHSGTLRKSINNYFNKNKSKYFLLLLLLIAGITAGMLFACSIDNENSNEITKKLVDVFKNSNDISKMHMFFSYFHKNLKCISAILLTAVCVYFMPLIFVNMGIWGFSIGFVSGFITLSFGIAGFFISLLLIMIQIIFMVPMVMFLSVAALDYTLHNIKSNKRLRHMNRKKLLVLTMLVFLILSLFSLTDIFLIPHLIKAVSVLI